MYLASLTWKKAEKNFTPNTVAIVPLGSVEEHGPLGPLGTDYLIPEEFARRIEADYPQDVVVFPAMPYGACDTLLSFPGTVDIGIETLTAVMRGIARSLLHWGLKKVIFINGHGGNNPALNAAALDIYKAGGLAAIVDWWILAGQMNPRWVGGHGAGQETAMMMALRPGWVNKEENFEEPVNHLSDNLINVHLHQIQFKNGFVRIVRDVRDSVPTGGFGGPDDPSMATEEWGHEMFDAVTEYMKDFVAEFLKLNLK
ncbi:MULTISPECIES: creatininase family protein [Aminobacterium]|jgi:creatinine amidohydrolase|uniref:creatininase family protein n=1 Tax=Aminobacterium TaxID=81466 RepID=UPI002580DD10|nr:creatininase family protein [Aminobacterium sp. UBA4834]